MLHKNFVTCSLVRLKEREQIHLLIGEKTKKVLAYALLVLKKLLNRLACIFAHECKSHVCG